MERNREYYEGILQLRNPNEEVLDFVLKLVKKRDIALISKKEKVRNGFDFYLTSQKFLQHIGKKLKRHFQGELKISSRLHTRSRITGKDVYRVNVLFRMHEFRKGDVVDYKGEKIRIIGISKKILAKDSKTGRKLTLNFGDL